MRVEAPSQSSGWCHVRAEVAPRLAEFGLHSARDFLALPGVVVSGHVGRNVSRVDLGGAVGYLKREHSVRWRDRWRNLLAGFGPASMSGREWSVLRYLEANDLPGPTWLACGEAAGEAFLLLEGLPDATEIRRLGRLEGRVPANIGLAVARLHAGGIHQPDLFAKHFLIDPNTGGVKVLDWQRAVPRARVSRRARIAALGTFRATCPPELLDDSGWRQCLRAYHDHFPEADTEEFARRVKTVADRLASRPGIRSHRVVPLVEQELVRIGGETVCAIPEAADELALPDVIASLYDPANDARPFRFRDGRTATLRVRHYANPFGRWMLAARGKPWRSAELKTARLLFHLERHDIGAPRLVAYGQSVSGLSAASFVLSQQPDAVPLTRKDLPLVQGLLNRLHGAGCVLGRLGATPGLFGVAGGRPVILEPGGFRLCRSPSRRQLLRDHARLATMFRTAP